MTTQTPALDPTENPTCLAAHEACGYAARMQLRALVERTLNPGPCGACDGSGIYDDIGSPPCGACDGSGVQHGEEPGALARTIATLLDALDIATGAEVVENRGECGAQLFDSAWHLPFAALRPPYAPSDALRAWLVFADGSKRSIGTDGQRWYLYNAVRPGDEVRFVVEAPTATGYERRTGTIFRHSHDGTVLVRTDGAPSEGGLP